MKQMRAWEQENLPNPLQLLGVLFFFSVPSVAIFFCELCPFLCYIVAIEFRTIPQTPTVSI